MRASALRASALRASALRASALLRQARHSVDGERAVLAVLALPLAAVMLAGGLLAVACLEGAQDVRRAQALAAVVPDLVRLQESVAAERTLAVRTLVIGRAAGDVARARSVTNQALSRATVSMRGLPAGRRPEAAAQLAAALRSVRRSIDTGHASASAARAGYSDVTVTIAAVPAAVAADVGEDRLAQLTSALAARIRAADAVAAAQLAGDRVLWAGRSAGRAEYDELAGRVAVLGLAMADLTFADLSIRDPALQADLQRLLGGAPARAGPSTWDAGGRRLSAVFLHEAQAAADDVSARSAGLIRVRTLQALSAAFTALAVVALGVAHGVRLGRRLGRRQAPFTGAVPVAPVAPVAPAPPVAPVAPVAPAPPVPGAGVGASARTRPYGVPLPPLGDNAVAEPVSPLTVRSAERAAPPAPGSARVPRPRGASSEAAERG